MHYINFKKFSIIKIIFFALAIVMLFSLASCRNSLLSEDKEIKNTYKFSELKNQIPEFYNKKIKCESGKLIINAEVITTGDQITSGDLISREMDWEHMCEILSPDKSLTRVEEEENTWVYSDPDLGMNNMGWTISLIATAFDSSIVYDNYPISSSESLDDVGVDAHDDIDKTLTYEQMANDLMEQLDLDYIAKSVCIYMQADGTEYSVVSMTRQLDGVNFAQVDHMIDRVYMQGQVSFENLDTLRCFDVSGNFEKSEAKECKLASWDAIMESFTSYAENDAFYVGGKQTITEIALEYLAKYEDGQFTYSPVWTFKVDDTYEKEYGNRQVFAALNAVTGELEYFFMEDIEINVS